MCLGLNLTIILSQRQSLHKEQNRAKGKKEEKKKGKRKNHNRKLKMLAISEVIWGLF